METTSENYAATSPTPKHNIVFTIPRTSSHLLLQILNLPQQPTVRKHERDGYFFLPALVARLKHGIAGKITAEWSEEARWAVWDAGQISYRSLLGFAISIDEETETNERVRGDGVKGRKRMFTKEHINWLLDPIAESHYLHPSISPPLSSETETEPRVVTPPASLKDPFLNTKSNTPVIEDGTSTTSQNHPSNPTFLPTPVLQIIQPTFLIRNPLLTFPSLIRTSIANEGLEKVLEEAESGFSMYRWECTFLWSRCLYEVYESWSDVDNNHSKPIVLDAADLDNRVLMCKYAQLVGLDPDVLRWEWDAATPEDVGKMHSVERRMKDSILSSTGIVQEKMRTDVVSEDEVGKWKVEFGDVISGMLERLVRDGWEDWVWLWEKRLKV